MSIESPSSLDPGSISDGKASPERPVGWTAAFRLDVVLVVLLAVALGHFLWAVSVGWNNTLSDARAFRQAQTAISTYYMLEHPLKLAYDTPVLGPPWSVPMEFPLYEWIVAYVVKGFGTRLEQAGRFVSIAFYLLTLIPAYALLRSLRVAPPHCLVAIAIMLCSPFYMFWSRTFLIETCALFFCVAYLAAAARAVEKADTWRVALTIALGSAGALAKITTVFPFFVGVALFAFRGPAALRPRSWRLIMKPLRLTLLLVGPPMAAGIAWTLYSDAVKEHSPLGRFLTSGHLAAFNIGTVWQRFSPRMWAAILGRVPGLFGMAHPAWVFWAACSVGALLLIAGNPRRRQVLACIALFLIAPLLFMNLHRIHEYYMCANGVFLLGAASLLVIGVIEKSHSKLGAVLAVVVFFLSGSLGHSADYFELQSRSDERVLPLAQRIRDASDRDDVNVYVGFDWDPQIPYYSQRRALMIPEWPALGLSFRDVATAIGELRAQSVGVLVIRHPTRWRVELVQAELDRAGITPKAVIVVN